MQEFMGQYLQTANQETTERQGKQAQDARKQMNQNTINLLYSRFKVKGLTLAEMKRLINLLEKQEEKDHEKIVKIRKAIANTNNVILTEIHKKN